MRTLKKALCIVLALVMVVGLLTIAAGAKSLSDYSDADKVSDDYKIAVDCNTQLGVLKGMTETTYEPQGTLTRAQLATIIYRIVTGDVNDKYVENYAKAERFSDVPSDAWFAGYVNYCADNGYLKGMGDGKYDPAGTLTGYQAQAALLRALGYDKNHEYEGTDWYVAVTKDAKKINSGIVADWAKPISREIAAQLTWNTLMATPVMWVAALGDYIGIPDEYMGMAGDNPAIAALGLSPLIFSVFGATDADVDFSIPAFVIYSGKKPLVTIPISPVKEYNTKVDICAMLVDAGIPKTDTGVYCFDLYQNGEYIGYNEGITHAKNAQGKNICEVMDDLHGQGVVTKIYDMSQIAFYGDYLEGDYVISQTWYYLAQVIDVKEDAHGDAGATTLKVWCKGAGEDPIEVEVANSGYEVGTWVIVHDVFTGKQLAPVQIDDGYDEQYKAVNDAPKNARVYPPTERSTFVIDYEPTTVTGVLKDVTVNDKEAKVTFKVDKKDYDLNIDYFMSAAMGDKDFEGRTFTFFLDKFGNLIGDKEVLSATNYVVVDRIAYFAKELDNGYAAANLVHMDATKDPAFKLTKIWNAEEEAFIAFVNGDALDDAIDFDAAPEAPSQDWWQNEDWEAPLYILSGTTLKPIEDYLEKAEFTKGQILIKAAEEEEEDDGSANTNKEDEESVSAIYVNSKTIFLYRTGKRSTGYEYASYVGASKAPSFNNSTVYYVLAKDSKFASVVFVADNSKGDGSDKDLIIPAGIKPDKTVYIGSNPDKIPVSTYTVYDLEGNKVEVEVMGEDMNKEFQALEAGLYNVKFDEDGYVKATDEDKPDVTSLTEGDSKYAAVTVDKDDEFDGLAFIDTSEDPDFMYNFDGAKVIVIGKTVKATTLTEDTSEQLAKYFTYNDKEGATNYMFYVLKAEAEDPAYSVVYVMEAAGV